MSLSKFYFSGRFGFGLNCSIIHYVREGETLDGCPVIFFPKDPAKVVEGTTYEFEAHPTRDATYTVDDRGTKTTYRVVHAVGLRPVDSGEGDFIDVIAHRTSGENGPINLGSTLTPEVAAQLNALRARLAQG